MTHFDKQNTKQWKEMKMGDTEATGETEINSDNFVIEERQQSSQTHSVQNKHASHYQGMPTLAGMCKSVLLFQWR